MIVPVMQIVQLRQDEDGLWIAKSPLLPGCHATVVTGARLLCDSNKPRKRILKRSLKPGRPIPEAFRDKFVLAA